MTTNAPLWRTPARRRFLLCKSGAIHVISFYLITRHNTLIITEGWVLRCLQTSIFIETPSLEGLSAKAKEDRSPHEMRLSPVGNQPSIVIIIIIIILIIIIIEITNSKNLLKNSVEIKPQKIALDFKNLSQF